MMADAGARRTHEDPVKVRAFDTVDAYWDEIGRRRRYSIPHDDGSFFSDGSGYSNGPESDLRYEIVERMREVAARLEQIDRQDLSVALEAKTNTGFIPYADDIEHDIRLTRHALAVFEQDEIADGVLEEWQQTFAATAAKWIERSAAMCGVFIENAAGAAGKEFGPLIVLGGSLAAALYVAGVDFQGIAAAIGALIMVRAGKS